MKNALNQFKTLKKITFRKMASLVGYNSQATIFKHCKSGCLIPAEAAIKYNKAFGIPLSDLRPDLWPPAPAPEREEA